MFQNLFRFRKSTIVAETKRQQFERLVSELNTMLEELPTKPKLTFDPENGHIAFDAPAQFSDETLALPSPDPEPEAPVADAEIGEKLVNGDAVAKPSAPTPRPPVPRTPTPRAPEPRP